MNHSTNKPRQKSPYYFPAEMAVTSEEAKKLTEKQTKKAASDATHHHLGALIRAFGSQGVSCGHTHHNPNNNTHPEDIVGEESQIACPVFPEAEIEEAEDRFVKIGKAGEVITSLGGALAIGPVLCWMTNTQTTESFWFKINADAKVSPAIFLISFGLVLLAAYGAPACHAQLEIASRVRNNFVTLAIYAQKLLKWKNNQDYEIDNPQLNMPKLKIGNKNIAVDEFTLIDSSEAPSLSSVQRLQIIGDAEQHFNEYVGLTIIAILRNIDNPIGKGILIALSLVAAAYACWPEVTTCKNTLLLMNALEKGMIIKTSDEANNANWHTTISAVLKIPAVFYANFLSFQQICYGNFYAGLILALLATKGNIITQYFINMNTQTAGEKQSNTEKNFQLDNRKAWNKLSFLGKELVVSRAFGTGNERSEPITITFIAIINLAGKTLSKKAQAAIALCFFLAGTATAYSEARNATDHMARAGFFNQPPTIDKVEDVEDLDNMETNLLKNKTSQ